jgi:hypothetical protein
MNEASRWRLDMAQGFALAYDSPQVRAVLLAGSVARGIADRYSDVEMTVFWDGAPPDEARRQAVERGGGVLINFYDYDAENGEWSDDINLRGVEFQVSHRTIETTETWLADVVERADTSLVKQDLISIIQYALPLKGADLIETWQARVAQYPDALQAAMVKEHLWFKSRWNRRKLVERDETLLLYEDFVAAEKAILLALMALNRVYLPHLGFKWMDLLCADLRIAPTNLAARLRGVFQEPLPEAVAILDDLITETFDLLALHLSHLDIREAQAAFYEVRPIWDEPPMGQQIQDE